MSKRTIGADKTCLLHGPGHSSEEFKSLKEYSKVHRTAATKNTEARSGGKTKHNKTVNFGRSVKEANITE